jgi:hypothetical protein
VTRPGWRRYGAGAGEGDYLLEREKEKEMRRKMNTLKNDLPTITWRPTKKPSLPAWQVAALFLTTALAPLFRLNCFPFRCSASLANLLALCLLCPTIVPAQSEFAIDLSAATEQSFLAPEIWAREFTTEQRWGYEHPRLLADVNRDGKQDIVAFGDNGVWLGTSTGQAFAPAFVLADFGYLQGWRVKEHVRLLGDVNGDGFDDVVGFGNAGVYRSFWNGSGFAPATWVLAHYGYDQGWRVGIHERLLADVNNDGCKDIVAFFDDGVWLSLGNRAGFFAEPRRVLNDFGSNQAWTPYKHIRTTADVNGDGRQDIVGFGDAGVWIALSTGIGFSAPQFVLADFGYNAENWAGTPRLLVDINKDGKQDIVGFGDDGVWTALSTGAGFAAAQFVLADFGYSQGWDGIPHQRFVTDLNGDGYQDIVGFKTELVYRSLGGPSGFAGVQGVLRGLVAEVSSAWFWSLSSLDLHFPDRVQRTHPRLVGDVDGDGLADLVGFDLADVKVARSSAIPPQPPPAAPSNLRITNSTTTSLSLAWNDNSGDEEHFIIRYREADDDYVHVVTLNPNATAHVVSSLFPDRQYCFTAQSAKPSGLSAESPRVCGYTQQITSIFMARQQTTPNFDPPYRGEFGPVSGGARVLNIKFPAQAMLLLKPRQGIDKCGDPDASVRVQGDMTTEQKRAIWGTATPVISGGQTLKFLGCTANGQQPSRVPVQITWSRQ